jgi:ariadne-1
LTKNAGVYHRCKRSAEINVEDIALSPKKKIKKGVDVKYSCQICFDDELSQDEIFAMSCGHAFCRDCWSSFIKAKVDDGPSCIEATCPDIKCKEIITEEEVKELAPEILPKFVSYQLRNFVAVDATSRWCPGPECQYIATLPGTDSISDHGINVLCKNCDTSFCLGCGDEVHEPITCSDNLLWKENFMNESSETWILQNTKPCPKCRVRIEKNQGCNHMTCKQCRHEFCWICNGDWASHSQCNRFGSELSQGQERELARGLHYFKRFQIHEDAQRYAVVELKKVQDKLLNVTFSSEKTCSDLETVENLREIVIKANRQLVQCRQTLKCTYIFAYYHLHKMQETNEGSSVSQTQNKMKAEQFEYHQEMLERFTEELSAITEKPLKEIEKLELVNKTVAVKTFLDRIVSYVIDEMYPIVV